MQRRIAPLVLVLLALCLVSACSDSAAPAPTGPRPMGPENPNVPPPPENWLASVCTALTPAVRSASPVPAPVPGDPVGSRDRLVAYLDERIPALRTAADGVAAAGPAPAAAGLSVTTPVLTLLNNRVQTLTRIRERLVTVPANAVGTLVATLERVRGQLVLAGPTISVTDIALPPDLAAAATRVPACRALGIGSPR